MVQDEKAVHNLTLANKDYFYFLFPPFDLPQSPGIINIRLGRRDIEIKWHSRLFGWAITVYSYPRQTQTFIKWQDRLKWQNILCELLQYEIPGMNTKEKFDWQKR